MKTILISLFFLLSVYSYSQEVICTAGSSQYEWTLGESFIFSSNSLSSGFQQGNLIVTTINNIKTVKISVFPNPVIDILNIKCDAENELNLTLIDISGKVILTTSFNDNFNINFSSLSKSSYILKINTDTETSIHKIIKK